MVWRSPKVQIGMKPSTPPALKTPAQRALYNNLGKNEALALELHESIVEYKPNGWRGIDTREKAVKQAIYKVLKSVDETERIFEIVKNQTEY